MSSKVGKRLKAAKGLVEASRLYSLGEAVAVIDKFPRAKFDESVDLAIGLGVNPRKAEENVRGTIALPNGTGKAVRLLAFCKGEKVKEAEAAGADFVGVEDLLEKIKDGWFDFDAVVATPDVMGLVGRVGKLLGPRGLMPNPKVGTVTAEIGKAVEAIKAGRVEFRVEKTGILHLGIGRCSFGEEKILANVSSVMDAVLKAKPQSSKGAYIKSVYISTTMGPSVAVNPAEFKL